MPVMISCLTYILVALCTLGTLALNYGGTCDNSNDLTGDHYFTALCTTDSGGLRVTTEDLNLCIGNHGGTLVAQDK